MYVTRTLRTHLMHVYSYLFMLFTFRSSVGRSRKLTIFSSASHLRCLLQQAIRTLALCVCVCVCVFLLWFLGKCWLWICIIRFFYGSGYGSYGCFSLAAFSLLHESHEMFVNCTKKFFFYACRASVAKFHWFFFKKQLGKNCACISILVSITALLHT